MQCQYTDYGAMSKEGAVCSFCLPQVQKRLLKCSFSHPVPHTVLYFSSPHASPCASSSLFICWASFLCLQDSISCSLSPPAPSPLRASGSILAMFDAGVTTVRTSSTPSFHDCEQVGRGGAPSFPLAHLEPTAGKLGHSLLCPQGWLFHAEKT